MPSAPLIPCVVPGCPALLIQSSGRRCNTHRHDSERVRRAERSTQDLRFYHSSVWLRFRKMVLAKRSLCEMDCKDRGLLNPGKDVDHIKPLAKGGEPLSEDNVRVGCHACHSRRTARDQSGWGARA